MNNPIYMSGPWITELEEKYVLDAMRNGWYGPKQYWYVETFEREFAAWHDRKYALMTPNCTSAIHLLLAGLGITDGDEVIVPDCTWIASAAPIKQLHGTTIFGDISEHDWCLSPETIAAKITPRTKAVIVVDLFGNMPDWDGIHALCASKGIHVIEDSAEALGSSYKGIKAGKMGVGSVFSFHRTKTIVTGEGGMLLLDDEALFKRCKLLRDHGREPGAWYNTEVAYKYMPFNLQAALGYAQFQRIDQLLAYKRYLLNGYRERLADIPDLFLNPEPEGGVNGVWAPALVFGKSHGMTKARAMDELTALNLPVRPFYWPLSSLPAYGSRAAEYALLNPVAYDLSERAINLPSAFNVDDGQLDTYCDGIRRILGR